MKIGFDNDFYVLKQTEHILDRVKHSKGKLYLEFGGKLLDDKHASRVLPGFDPAVKIKILETLKDKAETIIVISAKDLESNKVRADYMIDYGTDLIRIINIFNQKQIDINSVVITQYSNQKAADIFKKKLERRGLKVFIHTKTKGYPTDVNTIISEEGYGKNPYIPTSKPLVVVTAPGPGSGKLATCLCQIYHEFKNGKQAGYAKFETFPVWNLPLNHPLNMAYEAATADLKDVNQIDYYHLKNYGITTVNYNRDLEVFPVVKAILTKIMGDEVYKSPTDMGVNMVGIAITNDEICKEASKQEILRRYYKAKCEYIQGLTEKETITKIEMLMSSLSINENDRPVVEKVIQKSKKVSTTVVGIELPNGKIITGKQSQLLTASSAMVLNAIKELAEIKDNVNLISPSILNPILEMKKTLLIEDEPLNLEDIMIALSICAQEDKTAKKAFDQIPLLSACEAHASCIITKNDNQYIQKLNLYLTCEPTFETIIK